MDTQLSDEFWTNFLNDIDNTTSAETNLEAAFLEEEAHKEPFFQEPSLLLVEPPPSLLVEPFPRPMYTAFAAAATAPPPPPSTDLRRTMDDILSRVPYMTLASFKKEAANAWRRKYPDENVPMRDFQAFVKSNINFVRNANPQASHAEHMREVGGMWREAKKNKKRKQ